MTEPTGHLTPEQLDELATQASADIDPDQPAVTHGPDQALDRHLTDCATCRTALGDQIAVQGWLRRAPSPGPMPSDVVTRIEAALATARRDDVPVGTVLPLRPDSARTSLLARIAESRATKTLVAAAAVVAIGVGGYAAINQNSSRNGSSASSAGAGTTSGAVGPKAAGGGQDSAAPLVRSSGTAYTTKNIAAQVAKQLTVVPEQPALSETAGTSTLSTPAGLHSCLTSLGYPTVTPLLIDLATFNGKPVAVLVLPGDATGRQIWVVSRGCSTAGDGMAYYGLLH